jgi:hypothetical protein
VRCVADSKGQPSDDHELVKFNIKAPTGAEASKWGDDAKFSMEVSRGYHKAKAFTSHTNL